MIMTQKHNERKHSPNTPRRKSTRPQTPSSAGRSAGKRPVTTIRKSYTMTEVYDDSDDHNFGIQRVKSFPPAPPLSGGGGSNHERRSSKLKEQTPIRQQRLERQLTERKLERPTRKSIRGSSPTPVKRNRSDQPLKRTSVSAAGKTKGVNRTTSDSGLQSMKLLKAKGKSRRNDLVRSSSNGNLNGGIRTKRNSVLETYEDAAPSTPSQNRKSISVKSKDSKTKTKKKKKPRRPSSGSGSGDIEESRNGRSKSSNSSDEEVGGKRRSRRSPSGLTRTLSSGSLRNSSSHSNHERNGLRNSAHERNALRNSGHERNALRNSNHERNAGLERNSNHERPGLVRSASIPWKIDENEDEESIDSTEMVFQKPVKALVLVWILVVAELLLDFITTIISFRAYKNEDYCCDELIDLGNLPLFIIVPFFFTILAELIVLLITIKLTVYRSKKELVQAQKDKLREKKRLEVLLGRPSSAGSNTNMIRTFAQHWIVPKEGVVWYSTMNIFLLLNPFFGFLAAWMLLYQSSESECFVVLAIEALATVLHWISVHLEKKGRNEPYTQCTYLIQASPLVPLLSLVIVVFVYWHKSGVCYKVGESKFWYDGCQFCPNDGLFGSLPDEDGLCLDGNPAKQTTNCDVGPNKFCFFEYGNG